MTALYNEIDPYAAAWLRNLSDAGHIARGVVDTRSIAELAPDDVRHATQAHFFAGIGAWSYALRLAGWPDDVPVWTGSCPCQPFSVAGKRGGTADARHLWPDWFRLIRECRPVVVLGEQVASRDGYVWLDAVHADLEGSDYTVGAAVLPAAGVGAPHGRHRIWYVAIAAGARLEGLGQRWGPRSRWEGSAAERGGADGGVGHAQRDGLRSGRRAAAVVADQPGHRSLRGMAAPPCPWRDVVWLPCRDGKARPAQPGTFPLAHGAPARVGRLRAYGNAIVPQAATAFILAFLDTLIGDSDV